MSVSAASSVQRYAKPSERQCQVLFWKNPFLNSVSVSGLDPREFDLTDLRRAWYSADRPGHFSLTEAPLPHPNPTPPNTLKRSRTGLEAEPRRSQTEPNGAETEPKGAEMDRNQVFWGGTGGGFVGVGGWGGCKEKRKSLHTRAFLEHVI